jgi:hypothetical protein
MLEQVVQWKTLLKPLHGMSKAEILGLVDIAER